MKKSSLLILIITFILSIFVLTFHGGAVNDDQMKTYFKKVEILDCKVIKSPEGDITKLLYVDFDTTENIGYVYINYRIEPEDATESTAYEFKAVEGDLDLVTINGNRIEFSAPGAVIVYLVTKDNSNLSDSCWIVCRE